MINIREEIFKVWGNGMLIIFFHSKRNCLYCDTYCGVTESFSAPNYYVRASHLPVIGRIEGQFYNEVGRLLDRYFSKDRMPAEALAKAGGGGGSRTQKMVMITIGY